MSERRKIMVHANQSFFFRLGKTRCIFINFLHLLLFFTPQSALQSRGLFHFLRTCCYFSFSDNTLVCYCLHFLTPFPHENWDFTPNQTLANRRVSCRCCGITCFLLKGEFGLKTNESCCGKKRDADNGDCHHRSTVKAWKKREQVSCGEKAICFLWPISGQINISAQSRRF